MNGPFFQQKVYDWPHFSGLVYERPHFSDTTLTRVNCCKLIRSFTHHFLLPGGQSRDTRGNLTRFNGVFLSIQGMFSFISLCDSFQM